MPSSRQPSDAADSSRKIRRLAQRMAADRIEMDRLVATAVEAGMTCTQVGRLMVPPVSKQAIAKQLKIKNPGPLRAARSGAPPKS